MSDERFQYLEFGQGTPAAAPEAKAGKDHRHFMAEARRAYLEGDYEPALRNFSESLKHDKGQHEAWAGQVRCLVLLNELNEAKTWAEKACNLFVDSPVLLSAKARALAACGFLGEAMASSDNALETAEKAGLADPHLWLERGACLLAQQQVKTAELCFGKALELVPNDPDWLQRVAVEWLEGSQPTRALALLQQVTEQRPQRAYGWLLQARAQRRLGQKRAAQESLGHAETLRAGWPAIAEERRHLKSNCWIATLVFGHESAPAVIALRRWRDQAWLTCRAGRWAAEAYQRTAPTVCRALRHLPPLCAVARWFLLCFVAWIQRREERTRGQKTRA